MTLLVGPYLVSCWYVFGDPLYSINYHTRNYLAVEGASVASRPTAVAYVGGKALTRPYRTLDTVAVGMTSYPFSNKWDGFDRWIPGLGEWLSYAALRESLRSPEAVTIAAGERDGAFFAEGWYPPVTAGSVTARVSEGRVSIVEIPLPRVADYSMTVRLDPFPRPSEGTAHMPTVRVFLNRAFLCDLPLRWNPERVGSYDITLPRAAVKDGPNRLVLTLAPGPGANSPDGGPPQPGLSDGAAFRLWYVRVRPPTSQAQ